MNRILDWIKQNKLTVLLLAIIAALLLGQTTYFTSSSVTTSKRMAEPMPLRSAPSVGMSRDEAIAPPIEQVPPSDSQDRLVIRDTSLSMQVEDVDQTISRIESLAKENNGFLVSSSVNVPGAAATGSITIRVPEDSRQQVAKSIKELGIKTVSENVSGRDVTDQYEDISAKLETLETTQAKFQSILNEATEIQDILEVQRELISLQNQIDKLRGRQEYLEQSARLTKITVHLSTDELALPYTPDEAWRPEVIFKEAVHSLVKAVRGIGNLFIWIAVYAVIWVPPLVIYLVWKRRQASP